MNLPPTTSWTCFHCDETFTTRDSARDHFGFSPSADPGCVIRLGSERGLLKELRRVEQELADAWQTIHNESTEAAKAYFSMVSRHARQLVLVEEAGYERGLHDLSQLSRDLLATQERAERLVELLRDCRGSHWLGRSGMQHNNPHLDSIWRGLVEATDACAALEKDQAND